MMIKNGTLSIFIEDRSQQAHFKELFKLWNYQLTEFTEPEFNCQRAQ